ncbi:unnamed protein product [Cuscuta epithymum]|uniref:Uncharacterized protein n=1 Tax=Cuscuta epithymum TaxID=186058 RepID=A0AAV0EM57_9ASTE|nr:unnamed protein product [Cuscuta epithymum]
MDNDFWTSRIAAAKRQFNLQNHHHTSYHSNTRHISQLDRLNIDEVEVEEEVRPDFPCPYCYEDFDINSLCSHLEDEHSCESKPTRRRRLRKVAIPSSQAALSLLGKDLREAHLQVLLGGGSSGFRSTTATTSSSSVDPFLSSLVLNFPVSEADEISSKPEDTCMKSEASRHTWKLCFDPSLSYEERKEKIKQANGRAFFLQDLFASALLAE